MKKFIPLLMITLVVTGLYLGFKESGMLQEFDDAIHQRNGWKRTGIAQYAKYETVTRQFVYFSILKDPQTEDTRIFEGTMKKAAVDRMEHVATDSIEITGMKSTEIHSYLKSIAAAHDSNTIIIDGRYHGVSTNIKGFGIGG